MSMHRLMAAQARSVVGQVSQFGAPRCGLVASFNPQTYCAKVMIQPENTLTGWLPILSSWVGPGWGLRGAAADRRAGAGVAGPQ